MNPKILTGLVIVGLGLLYAIYDLFAYLNFGNESTISRILLEADSMTVAGMGLAIILAFAAGVFFGHVFLPQHVG